MCKCNFVRLLLYKKHFSFSTIFHGFAQVQIGDRQRINHKLILFNCSITNNQNKLIFDYSIN